MPAAKNKPERPLNAPPHPWRPLAGWLLVAVSVAGCLALTGAQPMRLFDREGLGNAADLLGGLRHPDLSAEFLLRVWHLSVESLLIGLLGTALAVVLGLLLALAATQVPDLPDPPRRQPRWMAQAGAGLRWSARLTLGLLRAVPEIVWAYLFVQMLGLGPGAAVLAIGLTSGGGIGKLCAELAEAVDPRSVTALRSTGASRWGILWFSVLPQVRRPWTAYALFRLECNIRNGTILGVVGAGGLGSEIALSIRYFQYDKLATTLLAVLVFVVALEALSQRLRRVHVRWALGLGALGSAGALAWLDVPWRDLWHAPGLSMLRFDGLALELPLLRQVVALTGDTLTMAWVATAVSAALAFALAPLTTRPLMAGSYLPDPLRPPLPVRALRASLLWLGRSVLQLTRAMPELTLALVFVVWVGGGALAGMAAIATHNLGVLGRLYADVLEEVEPGPAAALQAQGVGPLGVFLFAVLPAIGARMAAVTLYRFECNVRATVMVGFVGAGGLGDALNTAISLFHARDLTVLLITMVAIVALVDAVGDHVRGRILRARHRPSASAPPLPLSFPQTPRTPSHA